MVGAKVGVDLEGIVGTGLGWVGMGEDSAVKLGVWVGARVGLKTGLVVEEGGYSMINLGTYRLCPI